LKSDALLAKELDANPCGDVRDHLLDDQAVGSLGRPQCRERLIEVLEVVTLRLGVWEPAPPQDMRLFVILVNSR